ncbi:hypothetical protein ACIA8K_35085 [Catenuloplanes sp. NPDC051500]|uniref:hypothetical protein n=1 Tax=Catenuloplanes sp. NPDC051500 TaxID=3363959 RepID=UPI0037964144
MPRKRHPNGELEAVLRQAEVKDWTITGGGDKYFKMKCPCPKKCMKTVHLSPSGANYLRNLLGQLRRATCWED